ncbi:PBSX family phage terminase large subunit [Streptomyces sp. NPDC090106]|uniref:PBSX family phage terminase large subunit n=1 Tax=Streptomyces sp. NPDC090106 TaxID=3365946 RepID=UPI003810C232
MDFSALPLSRKQIEAIAGSTSRIVLYSGAVRSGKTISSLLRFLIDVAQAPRTGEIVVVAKTGQTAHRNLFTVLMNPDLFGPLAQQVQYTPGAPMAKILGRTVHVIGANDERAEAKLRGMTCCLIMIDEATLIPETFWTMALSRLSVTGAKLLATTNPDSPSHWLRANFIENDRIDMRLFEFALDDNPALDPAYVEAIRAEYVGIWYRRFILGEWCAAEGAVFDMFDRSRHVVDILPPITRWLALGVDYGTSNPTHAVLLGIGMDECLYAAADWRYDGRKAQRQLTDLETSERLREWLGSVRPPGARERGIQPGMVAVDPSAASFHAQLRRDGLAPRPAHNKVLSGIRILMALFAADKLRVHSSCKELLKEIDGYVWDPKATERGEDAPLKQNDHGVDALRYAVKTTQHIWRPQIDIPLSQADREDERAA